MIQLSLDIFFIRLYGLSLVDIAVFCAELKKHDFNVISKKITRRD